MNPFSDVIGSLADGSRREEDIYHAARSTRQKTQHDILLDTKSFKKDEILARVVMDVGYQDHRHSIIFIARPKALVPAISDLQDRIVEAFLRHGVQRSALWITPREKLHMTLMDIVSCVTKSRVDTLVPQIDVPAILNHDSKSDALQCTLKSPLLMVDRTALALTFLPQGHDTTHDSHVCLRSQLWQGCHETHTTPEMRYVSMSAHVTLLRFLDDVPVDAEIMSRLLTELQNITLDRLQDWVIKRSDIDCVYGQVYYGGGKTLH